MKYYTGDIAKLLKTCQLSANDVAKITGYNKSSVYRWKTENRIPICVFCAIRDHNKAKMKHRQFYRI